ncbi:Pentatricopeptide repeat-containing protein [Acorus calamus]|uniref:Pentatricopeptide repeat-containing protein n=1 Tax=Acorus calamus TaxID=4465 RepID=A0AAV9FIA5_ACOCL|nr:Pentatricopeptide repeat-containing protein [Acorus calamus]
MITGFAIHGRGQEALDMFAEMERTGVKPNQVTFTGFMTACSHAGLVDEGAGMLRDAEELIEKMSIRPNAYICGALLNACRIHKNFDMGRRVGKILIELDPDHGGRYIHLASIFATEGHRNEAVKLRKMMKDRGVSKLPGCSSMVLKEIYLEWDRISERLRQEGYVPLTDDLLLDLEEDEKEKAIHHHSEKLAIALALISTDTGTTI